MSASAAALLTLFMALAPAAWQRFTLWRAKRHRARRLWWFATRESIRLFDEVDGPKGPACRMCRTYLEADHEYGGHRFFCPMLGMGTYPLRKPERAHERWARENPLS